MFKNYFKVACRNIYKNQGFSTINISGLAFGMACSLLILLWVRDEQSVDAFQKNGNRLYYIYEKNYMGGKLETWYWTQGPLAAELKKEIPEVEAATPISWNNLNTFAAGDKTIKEDGFAAGADFFNMFSYPLIKGDAGTALNSPDGLSVSRKMATEFFGSPAASIGRTIRFENKKDFIIKAVFENFSPQVSNKADYILPWLAYQEDNDWAKYWPSVDPRTCILLRPDANPLATERKMAHLLNKFDTEQKNIRIELGLQGFGDYYLHSEFRNGIPSDGRIGYVRLFSIVALFILLVACINFMNLTTARSVKRAKEIGIRKVMGVVRGMLVRQFMGEAILMAILSALTALAIVILSLPAFNQLTGKQISLPYASGSFWLSLLGICLVTGILSGSYPAFYLSAFNPIQVLKSAQPSGSRKDILFRQGLVVFQFVLSVVLILSTLLITRQIHFLQNARLGYDRENLLYIPIEGELGKKLDLFRTEAGGLKGVKEVSFLSDNPTVMNNGSLSIGWPGKDPNEHERFIVESIGPGFLHTMNIQLRSGRDFSAAFPTDSTGCILNETAVALMGYQEPIGKTVEVANGHFHIVGVVRDFHFQSLHEKIMPLLLGLGRRTDYSTLLVRTQPGETPLALAGLEKLCKEMNPAFPFTYKFSDAEYALLYKGEEVTGRLSRIFAALAIFISCLGLVGLSLFKAEQRLKEIAVRKVLGASIPSLFTLLCRDFLLLIIMAFVLAIPVSWWAMNNWLRQFAYRTNIPWWIFGLSGLIALFVALATVSFQTARAAMVNPVKSLRSE